MSLIIKPCDFLEDDYQKVIYDWNTTQKDYPCDKTVVQLFEEQAAKTPHAIAIVYQHQHLTYQVLNQKSNQLARQIQQHYQHRHLNITPDTLIALCLDRSLDMFIGLLAILKTGAAYVPIDPGNPSERMRFILTDTNTHLMLTQQKMVDALLLSTPNNVQLLALDTADYYSEAINNLAENSVPSSLAYVIYTSGTTGTPKGVMITHRNIINYYANVSHYLNDVENIDFSTSIAFDLSVTTTLISLLCGKKIIIFSENLRSVEKYILHLQENNINFIKLTPSFLTQVFSFPQSTRIKVCFVGGEKLLKTQLDCLLKHCDVVYDEYGPTENTVGTLIKKTNKLSVVASIGKPYFNHKVYVLNENRQPVKIGVIGELYVGGAGLARGYLNQPALTQQRFIPNPFATDKDISDGYTHIYQTGDLVRWLPDGNLEYRGRNDFQVKIQGYRIELGEIEYALSRCATLLQSVVLFNDNLVAYYVSDTPLNEDLLIAHLKTLLPECMVPYHFIHMNEFPLTINGKVDREALKKTPIKRDKCAYLKPKTILEKKVCDIWQAVLGITQVSILDDFFRLGGDSIKCMQVMALLLREGIDCRVSDIFTHRTIQQLSLMLGKKRIINAESGILTGDMDLLPIQSWFFEQSFRKINHWNQSFLVRVPQLSIDRLNEILPQLIAHHDVLRICFIKNKEGLRRQTYGVKKIASTIKILSIDNEAVFTASQSEFDIEKGPLWQISYVTGYADGSARLYFAFHHLIIDSVSWRIIIDDIKLLYEGKSLGNKSSSYRQWVNALNHYAKKNSDDYLFWKNQEKEDDSKNHLSDKIVYAQFSLPHTETQQLISLANKAYYTEINDLLLTALALALSSFFKKSTHHITLEGHGREEIEDTLDISRTVGWFTSIYPIVLTVNEDIAASIVLIKEYLRTIPNKGIGYGAFKYISKNAVNKLPVITFNYLGQFDSFSGYWQVVREFSGESVHPDNKCPHLLDITGSLIDGSLHFSLSSYLSQAACTEIALIFEKQLCAVTTHCVSQINRGYQLFTPSDFKYFKISALLLEKLQKIDSGIEAINKATSLQQGFIYHAITQPHSDAYRVQFLLDYYCSLDIEKYKCAWQLTINKHPILRTYFNWDENLIQIVTRQGNLDFHLHDLCDEVDQTQALLEIQTRDRLVPFNLAKPTLMRLHLIQLNQSHYVLLKNSHHSILDGWSLSTLLNQVHEFYLDLLTENNPEVIVDNTYLQAQTYIANYQYQAIDYWNHQLEQIDHANDINAILSNPANLDAVKTVKIPQQTIISVADENFIILKELVNKTGITLNRMVQFAWHKLIQIYTNDLHTIVGTTISGRSIPVAGIDQSIGLYINTVPLTITWDNTCTILQQLREFESQFIGLNEHGFVELATLQKNGARLFHSLIIAEYDHNFTMHDEIHFQSRGTIEVLDYPLALVVYENQQELQLKLKYDATYLDSEKAFECLSQLCLILTQLSDKINLSHDNISILTEDDYQKIIYDWNNTATHYPSNTTVHRLFEKQVLKTPLATALIFNNEQLSYQALNEAANQLARQLPSKKLIALFFNHSFEMVISMLAVLKAGSAYVPIDPGYPAARITVLLKETQSACILTSIDLVDLLKAISPDNTPVIAVNKDTYSHYENNNLPGYAVPTELAYVIYTSGTTGSPKGVMVSHQNVCNYLSSIIKNEAYQQTTTSDCSSSIAFDATVAVLLAPLVSGRCVILCSLEIKRDTHLYLGYIKNYHVDLTRMTPSFLSALLTTHTDADLHAHFSQLRCLIVGGEKVNATDIRRWMQIIPGCHVINHYGPTETTVACSLFTMHTFSEIDALKNIPLGKPANNHTFYVLNDFYKPVPMGVMGELFIGGVGVTQGYLNQPELTEASFIANPFSQSDNNSRLYKTGDLVRWLPDGTLEFIGRNDFQVKIRGYRVELSEIENILLAVESISHCVVIRHEENSNASLVVYYVSASPLSSAVLKNIIANQLPDYMVPSIFIAMDAFPLTLNGKLNRNALPKPTWVDATFDYVAPEDELECLLCSLWQTILTVKRVGTHDDFFKLGGHSILAIRLCHQMSEATHRQINVADIFKYKTIAALCAVLRTGDSLSSIPPIAEKIAPLSFAQERLCFIEQYEGGGDVYHIPLVFELDNAICISALTHALQAIVNRHEILRTVLVQNQQGVYLQEIKEDEFFITQKTINADSFISERQAFLQKQFDLKTEYPLRAFLFYIEENNAVFLMLLFHHIAFDAWSKDIFMRELHYLYREKREGIPVSLPLLEVQYNDFSLWQRNLIAQRLDLLMPYWKNTLTGYTHLSFPADYPRPLTMDYQGDFFHFQLSKSHSLKLKEFAQSRGMTLYTVLMAAFIIVLSKYTGQSDLIIGTTTANRQHMQVAGLIGFFVNLLPLRIQLNIDNTFLDCLYITHENLIEAQLHQDLPFATLVEQLDSERDTTRHPLFQLLFNMDYNTLDCDDSLPWKPLCDESDYRRAKLDLSISMQDSEKGIKATLQYATCLFKQDTIIRFSNHYEKVLNDFIACIDQPIVTYSIISASEYQKIMHDWNTTDQNYPHDKLIHQLFEDQVRQSPDKIAINYEDKKLTYFALNEKSNQLAHAIQKYYREKNGIDLQPDSMIAFCLNRSIDMIIALLAILKAGAAYVPIEPHSPTERIYYQLDDTKSALVLTQSACVSIVKEACPSRTSLFVIDEYYYHKERKNNLKVATRPFNLAYIIYTSGTTGLPKGVMVEHKGLTNIVSHIPKALFLTENSRVIQFASIAFDASALQIFNSLTIGAELFIAPEEIRKDASALGHFLKKHKITYAGIPPVLLAHLDPTAYPDLITLAVAGEASNSALMARWRPNRYVINAYGPTENTIGTTVHQFEPNDSHAIIGHPLANVSVYVLDSHKMPVAIGVIGELYVGGLGVARGYLNQPGLTEERFIKNPFLQSKNKDRLYKTGDLVKWLPNGNLEFIGRNDSQVKIRGYRVELSEIENALLRVEGVSHCVVILHENKGDVKLVSYYVSASPLSSDALKKHIENNLPHYMVPSIFIFLEELPLTSNGKLNKKLLPEPVWTDEYADYAPPRNELELLLCALWQDLLTVARVGIHDDFFKLGGHSILAIHLCHQMSLVTHRQVSVADIFKYKTIAGLCAVLRTNDFLSDITVIEEAEKNAPLSFAQERLWFIEQYEGGTNAYHIPLVLELDCNININALLQALQAVIKKHEVLRTVFVQNSEGIYYQKMGEEPLTIIQEIVYLDNFLHKQQLFLKEPFDLTTQYPIRSCLFTVEDNSTLFLMFVFHHVSFDAWSKNIFMRELHNFYQAFINGTVYPLSQLTVQYRDFSVWQRDLLSKRIEPLMMYWKNTLNEYEPLSFPTDYPRPLMMDYRGDVFVIEFPSALMEKLNTVAFNNNATLFSILLTGFAIVVSKYTGQNDLLIGTPIVDRQHPQLSNLIGLFVNTLVLRIKLSTENTVEDIIKLVQKTIIEAQWHQDLPFEQLINGLNLMRDTSRHPLFQTLFTVSHTENDLPENKLWTPIEFQSDSQTAKFDLAVAIQTSKTTANVSIQYATTLFKRETIASFAMHYENILNEMVKSNALPKYYAVLSPIEYQKITNTWNLTQKNYPQNCTIQFAFQQQAQKTPNNVAIVFENQQVTYQELDELSNQLAHLILNNYQNDSMQSDTLIGLCVERSLHAVIGILGILKSGAAYVPIDPHFPESRIDFIIDDTECKFILTDEKYHDLFSKRDNICLINIDKNLYKNNSIAPLPLKNKSTDLAYVIYTSGTTGFPKGVMIEHRSVICLMHSTLCHSIDVSTRGTLWTNITFDVSVYEIFSLLLNGGELHILADEVRLDNKKLFEYIVSHQITDCYLPPFFVEKISGYLLQQNETIFLKNVLLSLEPIPVQHLAGFTEKNIAITNAYGPTETTVFSTAYDVKEIKEIDGKILPIGRALNNELTYVLDDHLSPVPVGVIGELYLGGDGLARGYWKKPELSCEQFIPNPFSKNTDKRNRLYKTGDLVRWLSDGNIEYIGRRDFQVKIHGMRIELAEIEQTVMMYSGITHSIVLSRPHLVAYYTGQRQDDVLLRNFIVSQLPDYMVPLAFIHLDYFPLNANGKLNREALILPDIQNNQKESIAPRHEMDAIVCAIWEDVLQCSKININDDFFALGGDSIASLQVISKLRYAKINCTIKDIFLYRTIERLVDHLLNNMTSIEMDAEQGILKGTFDLLPIQQWFFDQSFPIPNHWNQAFFVSVPELSIERLESAIILLIQHHDMLRVQFIKNDSHLWQQVYEPTIKTQALSTLTLNAQTDLMAYLDACQGGLSIETGLLWKIIYIDGYSDRSARLFFVCHHLIIDIVSWRILINDLRRLYDGDRLGAKTSSYRQWQRAITSYAISHEHERNFWDKMNTAQNYFPSAKHTSESFTLNESLTVQLIKDSHRAYHTKIDDILLTALAYALHHTMNANQFFVTLEGHGREWIDETISVSETVGWFTTFYPVNLTIKNTIAETIKSIKDHLRSIPNKGIGYGTLYGHKNLPNIYFNYQGQFSAADNNPWSLISEKTGVSIHPDNRYDFLILLNAFVIDGKLTINCGTRLDDEHQKLFIKHFKTALNTIASHCMSQIKNQQFVYTPGDFKTVRTEADLLNLPIHHDAINHYQPFEMTSIQKAYALGRLHQFEIGNVANHVYTEFSFNRIEVTQLEKSLNQLIATHSEMRTVFDHHNLTQRYLPYDKALYFQITVDTFKMPYTEAALSSVRDKLTHVVYDVATYPLFHFCVSRFDDCDIVHASFDLLLLDAQARMKFFTELTHIYTQKNITLPKQTISFRDYQIYINMLKASDWYAFDKAYWQKKLPHLPLRPKLLLNADPRTITKPYFKLNKRLISSSVWQKFKKNAEFYGVSYASVLLSLYGFVISRFSEESDFLITMTLFNRYGIHPDVNKLWGDFTSTNLFGFSRKEGSAINFFKYTHDILWDDIGHALYTGLDVQRDLMALHQLEPTMAVSPLVFTCVVGDAQHRTEVPPYFISPDEQIDKRYWIAQTSQAWIDLQATERDGAFSSGWLYVSQLFSDDFIDALNEAYCNLIDYLAENDWQVPLPAIPLSDEQMLLITKANATYHDFPKQTLVSLFEHQAKERENALAVIDANGTYDYKTVQDKIKSLAIALHKKGIGCNQLIAVLCEKGLNQVVSTLGIMTTGAAYLPLHVEWPLGRIKDVLIEGNVSHILVSEMQWHNIKNTALIADYNIHRLDLISDTINKNTRIPFNPVESGDPAYVIFTSGSTGKPKGVCISHAGAVNTILAVNKEFDINKNDVVLALSELSFDLSVYDIFGVLAAGGVVVFPDQALAKEPTYWYSLIKKHGITVWNTVPQLMQLLLDTTGNSILNLRVILLSGDWVPLSLVTQLGALPCQPIVVSLGGATEASIWSIWYTIKNSASLHFVPYGFPMPNQTVTVLNALGEHCAAGVAGEIHLGGDGLAMGYWQDVEKTNQRFIDHPELGRLYKTGDLGKWNTAGFVEFLGRLDNQVKRNGNRVELDEIALKLMQLNGIDNALVRTYQDRLVAYLVSSDYKSKYTPEFNGEQFKLAQHGLRTDLTNTFIFDAYEFDESYYRTHKSYRQFSPHSISDFIIPSPVQKSKNKATKDIKNAFDLSLLLSVLSAKKLDDKILPKYSYPSAGSTYAVQCYVNISNSIAGLERGYYYYHPVSHALQRIDNQTIHDDFSLIFSVNQAAIEPLYGKDWQRLAYLELGHMLYLLTQQLCKINSGYELKINNMLPENETNFAFLFLNRAITQQPFLQPLNTTVLKKENADIFKGKKSFDLNDQTLFLQTSELGHIVRSAQALIIFEGDNTHTDWIQAGYQAQHCMNDWSTKKIAYCPLGLRPYDDAIYAIALGAMRSEDEFTPETHAVGPTFSDVVLAALSQQLPCYMLPHYFIKLETLPLTANGKIDFHALPDPVLNTQMQTAIAPRNSIEKIVCSVWEEVLELSTISITDDFFRIGGDSILSIHVTTKLRQRGFHCDVSSIFEHRCIEKLAPHVSAIPDDDNKVDDTHIDFTHLDLSNELLEQLQSRYQKV